MSPWQTSSDAHIVIQINIRKFEIELLSKKYKYLKHEGLEKVYKKCLDSEYKRSYKSMYKQITVENSVMIESKRRFGSEEEMYKLS